MNARSQAFASPVLIALLAVFAVGCQSPHASKGENVEKPVELLSQATVCCTDFSELSFKKLPARYEATLVLDAEDPVYQFDSGKSYVEAIVLPESEGATLLQIDSLVSRRNALSPSHAIFPVVTLLDGEFNAISTLDEMAFEYTSTLGGWRKLRFVVALTNEFSDTRYVLIHTSDEKLRQALSTQKPISVIQQSDFDTMIYVQPTLSKKRINFTETGTVNVLAYTHDQG